MLRTRKLEIEDSNNVITIDSIDECKVEEMKEFCIDIVGNLEPPSECCIYKVPKDLRKMNEAAYTPQIISIGPLHHGNNELSDMEKQKIRYRREFSKRIDIETWEKFIFYLEENEKLIRNCYAEMPKFPKLQFFTMVLYDAVFILEFFLRNFDHQNDFLVQKPRVRTSVFFDLLLLENQLPYFVLNDLYKLAYPNLHNSHGGQYPSFFSLCCKCLNDHMNIEIFEEGEGEVKHFTDFLRHNTMKNFPNPSARKLFATLPCSVKLQESGVKFKGTRGCWLNIRFEKKKLWIPWLQVNELKIPHIVIDDSTECLIRNMMALEQCHYPGETLVCNYINLMDNLINAEKDVDLLVDKKIIINAVGDTATIASMFNKLCLQINLSDSCYWEIGKDLIVHYYNPWNHAKATLKRVYFSNYWRGTGTIAAIVLLFLTLIQTICSVLPVV